MPQAGLQQQDRFSLIIVLSGHGAATIGEVRFVLQAAKVLLVSPGEFCELVHAPEQSLAFCLLAFSAYHEHNGQIKLVSKLDLPDSLSIEHLPSALSLIAEMEIKLQGAAADRLKANLLFQELLLVLCEHAIKEAKPVQERAVDAIMEYIERNYSKSITREELADIAGMSSDYFTRTFRKMTGQTPTDYLTDVRINHAKQALALTGDSFRAIAHNTGFSDEFYFSRKFKKATGMSPSAYAAKWKDKRKVVALQHHLTGHLLSLGIVPHGALKNGYYPLRQQLRETLDIGGYQPDLNKLVAAQPDLIILYDYWDEVTKPTAKIYNKIAPTVKVPFYSDWREQLLLIASATERMPEAAEWLEQYDRKAAGVRAKLQPVLGQESILLVGVGNNRMCIFGKRDVGAVLYGDLGLRMPEIVSEIAHFKEIEPVELFAYDADRIMLVSFRNDGSDAAKKGIAAVMRTVYGDPRWPRLKAVISGKVYSLLDEQHLYTLYTSFSHDLLLDRLQKLLMTE
jgi:ABC-type Fe3+-hydroxamate transport system substrate-binding protein/AraC-like DNA-binding protein